MYAEEKYVLYALQKNKDSIVLFVYTVMFVSIDDKVSKLMYHQITILTKDIVE